MTVSRERRLAEMGLGPLWKLRSRAPAPVRPEPVEGPVAKEEGSERIKLDPSWKKPVEATLPELERKLAVELPAVRPRVTLR